MGTADIRLVQVKGDIFDSKAGDKNPDPAPRRDISLLI